MSSILTRGEACWRYAAAPTEFELVLVGQHQGLRFRYQIGECAGLGGQFVPPHFDSWVEYTAYPLG